MAWAKDNIQVNAVLPGRSSGGGERVLSRGEIHNHPWRLPSQRNQEHLHLAGIHMSDGRGYRAANRGTTPIATMAL